MNDPSVHASILSNIAAPRTHRWTCVYPIYIDAKRPYGTGRRRIAREKSCWWPYSQLIVNAAVRLQLRTFHEVSGYVSRHSLFNGVQLIILLIRITPL